MEVSVSCGVAKEDAFFSHIDEHMLVCFGI